MIAVVHVEDSLVVLRDGAEAMSVPAAEVDFIVFRGGSGNDVFTNDSSIPSEIWGGGGNDVLRGGAAADVIHGGLGQDQIEGREGDDILYGGPGRDSLLGGAGNDALFGQSGADALSGGNGDDYLDGGEDGDQLTGGPGSDEFVVDPPGTSSLLVDWILDWAPGDESLAAGAVGGVPGSELDEGATIATAPGTVVEVEAGDTVSEDISFAD